MGDNSNSNTNTNESGGKFRNKAEKMESLSLSLQTERFPRDLLQRFMVSARRSELISGSGRVKQEEDGGGDGGADDEIELNLGLSLGGRFGIDKSKLVRSSSIAGTLPIVRDDDALAPAPAVSYSSLVRTSSLPVETEEEWRKRKELQSLRRMAAKRRRSEKQRNVLRSEKEERKSEREEYVAAMNRVGSSVGPPSGFPNWAGGGSSRQAAGGGGGGGGSVESQGGSGGSSTSEMDSRPAQGSNSGGEAGSHGHDATGSSGAKAREAARPSGTETENSSKNRGKEIGVNSVEDMPCVFTKGDGPNGRRIEGILYKYGKGQEVRIMCVCHGSFLSPAEFVKHAGGTDIDHPLKHIVVNHNPSL